MKSKRSFMIMALCLSTLAGLAQNTQSSGQVTEHSNLIGICRYRQVLQKLLVRPVLKT